VKSLIVDRVRLNYRIDGDDNLPPIVLINSLGTDLRMWDPQIALLSEKFRVVRYDIRGHGKSGVSNEAFTLERLGLDLLSLLDELSITRARLCGLSLGGMIAMWLAIHHCERVDWALFAHTAVRIGTNEGWNARIAAVQSGGMPAVREAVLGRFLSARFRAGHPGTVQWIGDMLEATNPLGYIAACDALRDADLRHVIREIKIPSLIVTGALDEATPPAQAEELHDAIDDSDLLIIPGVAHLSNIEQPEIFSACLISSSH
jgi:3-oxoadipate enol-lactonase